ncbi:RNA-directed DNA polymerase, eukaryota [Tanacetum coccineum]
MVILALAKRHKSIWQYEGFCSRVMEDLHQDADHSFSDNNSIGNKGRDSRKGGSILDVLDGMVKVGQAMGYDMDGCLKDMEKIIGSQGVPDVNFISLQETKLESISSMDVKFIWGNSRFDHISSDALGNSGGILCIWDPNVFSKDYHIISDNFIAIAGTWIPSNSNLLIISVYAPQPRVEKRLLWNYISSLITHWQGDALVLGDFNEVRNTEERRGSVFNLYGAADFNEFISSSGLIDIMLEGYSFTWSHPSACKMSKLDRFLVTEGFLSVFPHCSAICLDRHLSDHRPILLRELQVDYGATPFRFYHSWLNISGFDLMVSQTWNSLCFNDSNDMIRFKKKLQALKKYIREWIIVHKKKQMGRRDDISLKLNAIDKQLDQGNVNDDILLSRMNLMKQLHDIKSADSRDSFQKAKIKWAVEGDENSKFFHGIINRKRANLAIKGILADGDWIDAPCRVKAEFGNHFANRFRVPCDNRSRINFPFPNRLSSDQADLLEEPISSDEIRIAVWACGENKSPGPDGFTFEFFRRFWDFIGPDFCLAVKWFFDHSSFAKGCNSSFIALIPKVPDPKGVNDYRPISLIGSLYKVVTKILALRLSRTSRADDLSNGIMSISLRCVSVAISIRSRLLLDYVIEMSYLDSLGAAILDFLGGVSFDIIEAAAYSLGCSVMKTPFKYLGVPVGRLTLLKSVLGSTPCYWMSLFKVPKAVLATMEAMRREFFYGAQADERKIAWVKWSKVLSSKKNGGLGVSSFYALNRALLFKWVWRFISQDNSLWARVISAIHGPTFQVLAVSSPSLWNSIVREIHVLKSRGIDLVSYCKKRVGNGLRTRFWEEVWIGDQNLSKLFPRIFALENDKSCTVAAKLQDGLERSLRRQVRGGVEAQQLSQMQGAIVPSQ